MQPTASTARDLMEGAIDFAMATIRGHGPVAVSGESLLAGSTDLAADHALVDAVAEKWGCGCTLFLGNVRVSTTAVAAGRVERAVGTRANRRVTQQVLRRGQRFDGVARTIGKDWLITYVPLRSEAGPIVGMLAAYWELNTFLDDLSRVDGTPEAVLLVDPYDGRIVDANRTACDLSGTTLDVLRSQALHIRTHRARPEALPWVGGYETYEDRWIGPDEPTMVRVSLEGVRVDGQRRVVVVVRDFTEAHEAREVEARMKQRLEELNATLEAHVSARTEELHEALAQRDAMVGNLDDGLLAFDEAEQVDLVNPALRRLLGLPDGPVFSLKALPVEVSVLARTTLRSALSTSGEVPLASGGVGDLVVSPIEVDGRCVGGVGVLRDVTRAKEVDRMKTDFIATVSHELRTPLTSVMGFAKLARKRLQRTVVPATTEDAKVAKAVNVIDQNLHVIMEEGKRLSGLIHDVLDISKMEAGEVEWRDEDVDPVELVEKAVEVTQGLFLGTEVQCRAHAPVGLPIVRGDRERLLQVLVNLVSNAAKFTPKGRVDVCAELVGQEGVLFEVRDTGVGIEEVHQAAIFDKFKQAADTLTDKPRGTGLGLPISAQIVAHHGSELTVESKVGVGSTFRFALMGVYTVTPPVMVREVSYPVRHGDIVVVDDDPAMRNLLGQVLGDAGHRVRTVSNGASAVATIRSEPPDLVVLDVLMPGLTGFDVAAVLRSDPSLTGLPLLVLSVMEDTARSAAVGVDLTLTKPLEEAKLLAAVQKLLATETADETER